ncbi:unnamed protein product [Rhizophagus irregularis]|nr:unnamed protein product [Rhizophagus irregularis]
MEYTPLPSFAKYFIQSKFSYHWWNIALIAKSGDHQRMRNDAISCDSLYIIFLRHIEKARPVIANKFILELGVDETRNRRKWLGPIRQFLSETRS